MRQVDHHKQFEMFSTFFCVKKRATKLNILKGFLVSNWLVSQHHNVSFRNECQFYSHSWLWNPTAKHIVDGKKPANQLRFWVYPRYFNGVFLKHPMWLGMGFLKHQQTSIASRCFCALKVCTTTSWNPSAPRRETAEASKKSTRFFFARVIFFLESRFKTNLFFLMDRF